MHIIIVSVSSRRQLLFWAERLEGYADLVLVVEEDWKGGAGNGLGTLYAYAKARDKALERGVDLFEEQKGGASIALYHTAGAGKRLYPLTASEGGNKSAVKLSQDSLLEAVIKQTTPLARSRRGRLSVFWGDQLFVPSQSVEEPSHYHIDILVKAVDWPSEEVWRQRRYGDYGWVVGGVNLDKMDYGTFSAWAKAHALEASFGLSLGSFSLSTPMTLALLDLFQQELSTKQEQWDSDPYIWMPLTLDLETYVRAMAGRGIWEEAARGQWHRLREFSRQFCKAHPEMRLFGSIDIGREGYWWDFGTVQNYYGNLLKLAGEGREAEAMRQLFGVKKEGSSCLVDCQIGSGHVQNSVLVGVKADHLEVSDCVILHSSFRSLQAHQALLYHISGDKFNAAPGTIRADVALPASHLAFFTTMERDGKADWEKQLPGNACSYSDLVSLL